MQTVLPTTIKTIEKAKEFLKELHTNGESFHPEDDPRTVIWNGEPPSRREMTHLRNLMGMIYDLPGNKDSQNMAFDPCGYLLELHNA